MRSLEQLEFAFRSTDILSIGQPGISPGELTGKLRGRPTAETPVLQSRARELLHTLGAGRLACLVRVEWNWRLQTAAGRADYRAKLISLNPRLCDHHAPEIERTLRHELAHLLAQFRAGRRRILPHGPEWREACRDLGIGNERRCHELPFPVRNLARRYLYQCPHCRRNFPRVRQLRRAVACYACCRAHNHGRFTARFRLQLLQSAIKS
jgi:SprT protein